MSGFQSNVAYRLFGAGPPRTVYAGSLPHEGDVMFVSPLLPNKHTERFDKTDAVKYKVVTVERHVGPSHGAALQEYEPHVTVKPVGA